MLESTIALEIFIVLILSGVWDFPFPFVYLLYSQIW